MMSSPPSPAPEIRPPDTSAPPARAGRAGRRLRGPEWGLVWVVLLLGLALTLLSGARTGAGGALENRFLNPGNLTGNVLKPMSWFAILAVGATLVIAAGGIDISVGSIFGLSALAGAAVLQCLPEDAPFWRVLPVGLAVPLLVGGACGLINGALVVGLRLHPFIVTLGTLSIFRGLALVLVPQKTVPVGDHSLPLAFTRDWMAYKWKLAYGDTTLLLQPTPIAAMLTCVALAWLFLRCTVWGRQLYAVGGNEEAARFSGIPVGRVKLGVYTLSGLLAGAAGMVSCGYFGSATAGTGAGYELTVIAAAVVGGASLSGGRGTALGALLGTLIIRMIENGIDVVGEVDLGLFRLKIVNDYYLIIVGVAIIIAVAVDRLGEWLRQKQPR